MAVTMFRGDSVCVDVGPEDRVIIALTLTLDDDVADPTPTEVFGLRHSSCCCCYFSQPSAMF